MNNLLTKSALSAAIALSIVACSSGGGGGTAGIGGSGYISSGSITGFGSIFVNGVEFETDESTFDIDGEDGTQTNLAIGMVVRVSGSINDDGVTGNATHVSFDDELQGPVSSVSAPDADGVTRSFVVLGITVIVDSSSTSFDVDDDVLAGTVFDFDNINAGGNVNNVEVSGFFNSNGDILATRVELKDLDFDLNSEVEIKGTISELSVTSFKLGGLNVDASSAELEDLPDGLVNGIYVEVEGTLNATFTTLFATEVEAEDDEIDDSDDFEIEGLITDFVNNSNFKVNGISVDASNAEFEPSTLTLENDLRVEVEGSIVDNKLIATEVELEGGTLKVHAEVTSKNVVANTFQVTPNPVTGDTITITITTGTQLEDDTRENESVTLSDFVIGDFVEIQGFDDGNGGISATEVEIKEVGEVKVQGYTTELTGNTTNGTITVLGVTFDIASSTDFEKDSDTEGEDDVPLNGTEMTSLFNASVSSPQLVKIEDKKLGDGNAIGTADEIEIE